MAGTFDDETLVTLTKNLITARNRVDAATRVGIPAGICRYSPLMELVEIIRGEVRPAAIAILFDRGYRMRDHPEITQDTIWQPHILQVPLTHTYIGVIRLIELAQKLLSLNNNPLVPGGWTNATVIRQHATLKSVVDDILAKYYSLLQLDQTPGSVVPMFWGNDLEKELDMIAYLFLMMRVVHTEKWYTAKDASGGRIVMKSKRTECNNIRSAIVSICASEVFRIVRLFKLSDVASAAPPETTVYDVFASIWRNRIRGICEFEITPLMRQKANPDFLSRPDLQLCYLLYGTAFHMVESLCIGAALSRLFGLVTFYFFKTGRSVPIKLDSNAQPIWKFLRNNWSALLTAPYKPANLPYMSPYTLSTFRSGNAYKKLHIAEAVLEKTAKNRALELAMENVCKVAHTGPLRDPAGFVEFFESSELLTIMGAPCECLTLRALKTIPSTVTSIPTSASSTDMALLTAFDNAVPPTMTTVVLDATETEKAIREIPAPNCNVLTKIHGTVTPRGKSLMELKRFATTTPHTHTRRATAAAAAAPPPPATATCQRPIEMPLNSLIKAGKTPATVAKPAKKQAPKPEIIDLDSPSPRPSAVTPLRSTKQQQQQQQQQLSWAMFEPAMPPPPPPLLPIPTVPVMQAKTPTKADLPAQPIPIITEPPESPSESIVVADIVLSPIQDPAVATKAPEPPVVQIDDPSIVSTLAPSMDDVMEAQNMVSARNYLAKVLVSDVAGSQALQEAYELADVELEDWQGVLDGVTPYAIWNIMKEFSPDNPETTTLPTFSANFVKGAHDVVCVVPEMQPIVAAVAYLPQRVADPSTMVMAAAAHVSVSSPVRQGCMIGGQDILNQIVPRPKEEWKSDVANLTYSPSLPVDWMQKRVAAEVQIAQELHEVGIKYESDIQRPVLGAKGVWMSRRMDEQASASLCTLTTLPLTQNQMDVCVDYILEDIRSSTVDKIAVARPFRMDAIQAFYNRTFVPDRTTSSGLSFYEGFENFSNNLFLTFSLPFLRVAEDVPPDIATAASEVPIIPLDHPKWKSFMTPARMRELGRLQPTVPMFTEHESELKYLREGLSKVKSELKALEHKNADPFLTEEDKKNILQAKKELNNLIFQNEQRIQTLETAAEIFMPHWFFAVVTRYSDDSDRCQVMLFDGMLPFYASMGRHIQFPLLPESVWTADVYSMIKSVLRREFGLEPANIADNYFEPQQTNLVPCYSALNSMFALRIARTFFRTYINPGPEHATDEVDTGMSVEFNFEELSHKSLIQDLKVYATLLAHRQRVLFGNRPQLSIPRDATMPRLVSYVNRTLYHEQIDQCILWNLQAIDPGCIDWRAEINPGEYNRLCCEPEDLHGATFLFGMLCELQPVCDNPRWAAKLPLDNEERLQVLLPGHQELGYFPRNNYNSATANYFILPMYTNDAIASLRRWICFMFYVDQICDCWRVWIVDILGKQDLPDVQRTSLSAILGRPLETCQHTALRDRNRQFNTCTDVKYSGLFCLMAIREFVKYPENPNLWNFPNFQTAELEALRSVLICNTTIEINVRLAARAKARSRQPYGNPRIMAYKLLTTGRTVDVSVSELAKQRQQYEQILAETYMASAVEDEWSSVNVVDPNLIVQITSSVAKGLEQVVSQTAALQQRGQKIRQGVQIRARFAQIFSVLSVKLSKLINARGILEQIKSRLDAAFTNSEKLREEAVVLKKQITDRQATANVSHLQEALSAVEQKSRNISWPGMLKKSQCQSCIRHIKTLLPKIDQKLNLVKQWLYSWQAVERVLVETIDDVYLDAVVVSKHLLLNTQIKAMETRIEINKLGETTRLPRRLNLDDILRKLNERVDLLKEAEKIALRRHALKERLQQLETLGMQQETPAEVVTMFRLGNEEQQEFVERTITATELMNRQEVMRQLVVTYVTMLGMLMRAQTKQEEIDLLLQNIPAIRASGIQPYNNQDNRTPFGGMLPSEPSVTPSALWTNVQVRQQFDAIATLDSAEAATVHIVSWIEENIQILLEDVEVEERTMTAQIVDSIQLSAPVATEPSLPTYAFEVNQRMRVDEAIALTGDVLHLERVINNQKSLWNNHLNWVEKMRNVWQSVKEIYDKYKMMSYVPKNELPQEVSSTDMWHSFSAHPEMQAIADINLTPQILQNWLYYASEDLANDIRVLFCCYDTLKRMETVFRSIVKRMNRDRDSALRRYKKLHAGAAHSP